MLGLALGLVEAIAGLVLLSPSSPRERVAAGLIAAAYVTSGGVAITVLPNVTGFHYLYNSCVVSFDGMPVPEPWAATLVVYFVVHAPAAFLLGTLVARIACRRACRLATALASVAPFLPDAIARWAMVISMRHSRWDGTDLATAFLAGFAQDAVTAVVLVALVARPRAWPAEARPRGVHDLTWREVLADWRLPAAILAALPALGVALASTLLDGFGRVAVNSSGWASLAMELADLRLPILAGLLVAALVVSARFVAQATGLAPGLDVRGLATIGSALAAACATVALYAAVVGHWLDVNVGLAAPPRSSSEFGWDIDWRCAAVVALSVVVLAVTIVACLRSFRVAAKLPVRASHRASALAWLVAGLVLAAAAALVQAQGPRT